MKFGAVPVAQALGGILAHSVQAGDQKLRKGMVLGQADLEVLALAGLAEVTIAELAATDVHENDAAARLAQAVMGAGVTATDPFTGRVNLIAPGPGVARIDAAAITALNAIDPMITCATVAPHARMMAGGLLATIKIISYAVPEAAVRAAQQAAAQSVEGAVGHHPVRLKDATLIVTQTGAEPQMDKGVTATRGRLFALAMNLPQVVTVPHTSEAIAQALREVTTDLALILTASATSDPADVAPQAVRQAGGTITRFGMPVDPGNLLFLGDINGKPVIGLPGCARSPALNGADWVLERVACGLAVSDATIAAMGVGGLLKEIPQRPQPRQR